VLFTLCIGWKGMSLTILTNSLHLQSNISCRQVDAEFNLSIFYGRDSKVEDVLNACRRYPMFAEKQVVILKEAQHLKEIDRLESYLDHPLKSTIFIVSPQG